MLNRQDIQYRRIVGSDEFGKPNNQTIGGRNP
jgi:hypothetical protein